jgi:hypothetical protein
MEQREVTWDNGVKPEGGWHEVTTIRRDGGDTIAVRHLSKMTAVGDSGYDVVSGERARILEALRGGMPHVLDLRAESGEFRDSFGFSGDTSRVRDAAGETFCLVFPQGSDKRAELEELLR